MAGVQRLMTYLDTNVVVWLYAGKLDRLSQAAISTIEDANQLLLSPMVELELEYLFDIKRLTKPATDVLLTLRQDLPLHFCNRAMLDVIKVSKSIKWTRDPFDRIITAQASLSGGLLVTADRNIQQHYELAIW